MTGEPRPVPAPLLQGIRATNRYPVSGLQFLTIAVGVQVPQAALQEFADWLEKCTADLDFDVSLSELGSASIRESGAAWKRRHFRMYPLYVERLNVTTETDLEWLGSPVLLRQDRPGEWVVAEQVLDSTSELYYQKHEIAWRSALSRLVDAAENSFAGGFSFNTLEVPAEALRDGSVDLRPLVLHAIAPDGSACDRGKPDAQAAIANAFWQTYWATGARRAERGATFPVAFLPIDRSSHFEFAAPFEERYVSLRRRLFGRTSILAYALEALTKARELFFDSDTLQFKVGASFDPAAHGTSSADVLLAIGEMNRTGWVDAYTGDNRQLFPSWKETEACHQPAPWPYGVGNTPSPDLKIRARTRESDYLESVRVANEGSAVRIRRVVPYSGCAFLYEAATRLDELKSCGKVQDFDGEILAATNSTFFLNFPEEYATLHSAMNDAVALLVENGRTHQVKTLRRAAFFLGQNGETLVTTRAGNRLNSEVLVFEGESSSATYAHNSDKGFAQNRFGPLFFGAVTVGDSLVETFEEMATEVPSNGWIVGDSEAFGGRIQPRNVAEVQVFPSGSSEPMKIRHGFAVGPLLVEDGRPVPLGESREEFMPICMAENPSVEETSQLARTELPGALLNCDARGVPPTRFPYDWNLTRAPRSAIGVKANGDVVLAVVDGRADLAHSVGATLAELAQLMINLGCESAMNMDGGGSSVMFVRDPAAVPAKLRPHLRDGVVNLPSDMGGVERLLPVPLVLYRKSRS